MNRRQSPTHRAFWLTTLALTLVSPEAWSDGGGDDAARIVRRLAENTNAIKTITFRQAHFVTFRSTQTVYERTFQRIWIVDYDRIAQNIEVRYLAPITRIRHFDDDELVLASKDVLTGLPLWILNPVEQVKGWKLSILGKLGGAKTAIIGTTLPELMPISGFAPRWEATIDTGSNLLLSVTNFADSGEVQSVMSFENYGTSAGGKVRIPLRMRAKEFARLNRLEALDEITDFSATATTPGGGN